jgi:lipopolysaccharide/colanic/teichoic acid biosynthesis glycosyltransferase
VAGPAFLKEALKRGIDCAGALAGLLVLSPLILAVAAVVLADVGRPLMFRQVRVGRRGVPFTLVKFRTMRDLHEAAGRPLPDDRRVTAIGRFLRRSALDETPELVAVLAGRMSLVGPRPLPPDILAGMPLAAERTAMRPGLTGLAQVAGNTLLTNAEKLAIDLHYNRSWTIGLDCRILLKTVAMLIAGSRRDEALIGRALASMAAGEGEPEGAGGRARAPLR